MECDITFTYSNQKSRIPTTVAFLMIPRASKRLGFYHVSITSQIWLYGFCTSTIIRQTNIALSLYGLEFTALRIRSYLYFISPCRSDGLSHYLLDTDLAFDPDPGSEDFFPAIALAQAGNADGFGVRL
jgi:hypothetical protein